MTPEREAEVRQRATWKAPHQAHNVALLRDLLAAYDAALARATAAEVKLAERTAQLDALREVLAAARLAVQAHCPDFGSAPDGHAEPLAPWIDGLAKRATAAEAARDEAVKAETAMRARYSGALILADTAEDMLAKEQARAEAAERQVLGIREAARPFADEFYDGGLNDQERALVAALTDSAPLAARVIEEAERKGRAEAEGAAETRNAALVDEVHDALRSAEHRGEDVGAMARRVKAERTAARAEVERLREATDGLLRLFYTVPGSRDREEPAFDWNSGGCLTELRGAVIALARALLAAPTEPAITAEEVHAALRNAAPGANELLRTLNASAAAAPRDLVLGAAVPTEPAKEGP